MGEAASTHVEQALVRHESHRLVVGGLEAVVAVAAVAQELEALCGDVVAGPLGVVTSLEQRLEKVTRIVGELVEEQVSHAKSRKAARLHQPAQVRGGDGFPRVEGARSEGARLLLVGERLDVGASRQTLHSLDLFQGRVGELVGGGRVALHAEAKFAGRVVRGRHRFPTTLERHEARQPSGQQVGVEPIVERHDLPLTRAIPVEKFVRPFEQASLEGGRVPASRALLLLQRRGDLGQSGRHARLSVGAVRQVARGGDGVEKSRPPVGSASEAVGQTAAKRVHAFRENFGQVASLVEVGAAGTPHLVAAPAVVDAGLVVVVKVQSHPRRLDESHHEIGALPRAPAERLLTGARVCCRRHEKGLLTSGGVVVVVVVVVGGSAAKVAKAAENEVLHGHPLLTFKHRLPRFFLDQFHRLSVAAAASSSSSWSSRRRRTVVFYVGVFVVLVDEHVKTASASRNFIIVASSSSSLLTAAAAAAAAAAASPNLVDAGPGGVQVETAGEGIDEGRRRAAGSGGRR